MTRNEIANNLMAAPLSEQFVHSRRNRGYDDSKSMVKLASADWYKMRMDGGGNDASRGKTHRLWYWTALAGDLRRFVTSNSHHLYSSSSL
jgi:hypothetical protein